MDCHFRIVGLGEALFDVFPDRQVLGGSPLNVAVHAHQLGQVCGGCGVIVSRVGQDELGALLRRQLTARQMAVNYVQVDSDHATGKVLISVSEQGEPTYTIAENAAWDWLQWNPGLEDLARKCDALCFSTLAQRHHQSGHNILRFCTVARQAMRLFDPNLRQNFHDQRMLRRSCELATAIKLNCHELDVLSDQLGLKGESVGAKARALLNGYSLKFVAVTRGAQGTVIYTAGQYYEPEPVNYERIEGADNVGAGDAVTAAILVGQVLRLPMAAVAELANHAGAFVASVPGATPVLPQAILSRLK